jgi:hypothetical protein
MALNKVDLTVSQLINDLNSGLTWFKKDDLGYGSIEIKYGATAPQIMAIRKHPALKDAETSITIFNIIDDTKNNDNSSSPKSTNVGTTSNMEQPVVSVDGNHTTVGVNTTEAADIFANL